MPDNALRARARHLLHRVNRPALTETSALERRLGQLEQRLAQQDQIDQRVTELAEFADRLGHRLEELQERVGRTNELLFNLPDPQWREYLYQRSRERWSADEPDLALTWGTDLPGRPFVDKLAEHQLLDRPVDVLEVGPGWGRLLLALREIGAPVTSFTGLELSQARVERLVEQFADATTSFRPGDVDELDDDARYDLCISSLTFKHLFPSFERAAQRIHASLRPGGTLAIDLVEGRTQEFQHDQPETFVRAYTRDEASGILGRAGYDEIAFDVVTHQPGFERLLVLASKAT